MKKSETEYIDIVQFTDEKKRVRDNGKRAKPSSVPGLFCIDVFYGRGVGRAHANLPIYGDLSISINERQQKVSCSYAQLIIQNNL